MKQLETQSIDQLAADTATPIAELKDLRRVYGRIKRHGDIAKQMCLPLAYLQAISRALGTVDTKHNDLDAVLRAMLIACDRCSLDEAKEKLIKLADATLRPHTSRVNRFNFAKEENSNFMVHGHGVFQSSIARSIEHQAQPYIDSLRSKTPGVTYDQALAQWMVARLLRDDDTGVSRHQPIAETTPAEPEDYNGNAHHPVVIISGDPNIDYERGYVNTLDGGTIPLEEAINLRLANTGWVCWTSMENGKANLKLITPIIRERFSRGTHRLGVMLETLVCARCNMPATRCQAHHINAYHYHPQTEHDWNDLTNACRYHNGINDDDPAKPPKNGRMERDENGWPVHKYPPSGSTTKNPRHKFHEGWRGTTEQMARNERHDTVGE